MDFTVHCLESKHIKQRNKLYSVLMVPYLELKEGQEKGFKVEGVDDVTAAVCVEKTEHSIFDIKFTNDPVGVVVRAVGPWHGTKEIVQFSLMLICKVKNIDKLKIKNMLNAEKLQGDLL